MSDCGYYVPAIRAEFGRTITDTEIWNEFQEIERVMGCLWDLVDSTQTTENNTVDLGTVTENTTIRSSDGIVQYMAVEGDVNIYIAPPAVDDPRVITLMIVNAGDGRFNFVEGSAWTSDANGLTMDGKPWIVEWQANGDYGAMVTCVYDGEGWIHLVYARHNIDYAAVSANVADIYKWR